MKFRKLFAFITFSFLACANFAFAQEQEVPSTIKSPEAKIEARESFKAGQPIYIDGVSSVNYNPEFPLRYEWQMGDQYSSTAKSFQYVYTTPGYYDLELKVYQTVEELDEQSVLQQYYLESVVHKSIYAYNSTATLITDQDTNSSHLEKIFSRAGENYFYFNHIDGGDSMRLDASSEIVSKIQDKVVNLRESDLIFVWADPLVTLNALNSFKRLYPDSVDFSRKTIVLVSNSNLNTVSRIAQGTFLALQPESMLFIPESALDEVIGVEGNAQEFTKLLEERSYNFLKLDNENSQIQIWNFLSQMIGQMISKGISHEIILYLLMLPVIVTLVTFFRQVIGFSTAGVYAPTILTIAFIFIGPLNGFVILALIVMTSLLVRFLLRRRRLLFTPRIALNISAVALTVFLALYLAAIFDLVRFITISILPVLIMITLAEKITAVDGSKNAKQVFKLFSEMTLVALICYLVVEWRSFQIFMLAYPELVFAFVFINYLLGRWTGLRLFEYVRFRELITELTQKEEEE